MTSSQHSDTEHPRPAGLVSTAQPRGFWNLALTELWERFSYYGLQSVLTFYLIYSLADGGLALTPATAVGIVGAYGGATYLTQVAGAWLADRVVSPRILVVYGGFIIASGHIALAIVPGLTGLALGLTLIALGTGALKTNITSIVGILLKDRDRKNRDSGFSYFSMSINLGSIVGPLLTGLTQSRIGFHVAFGLAAVGMFIGLAQYCWNLRALPRETAEVKNPIGRRSLVLVSSAAVALGASLATLIVFDVVTMENLNNVVGFAIFATTAAIFTVILRARNVSALEKTRVRGYSPLWVGEAVYYGLQFQIFTTIPILVTERVNLDVLEWTIPEAWFSIAGTVACVLFIPLMATRWKNTALGSAQPTTKFAFGLMLIGVAYFLMTLTELASGNNVSPFYVMFCLALAGCAEVFVGPVGFSVVTRISPQAYNTQLVAVKILALGAASYLSGVFGDLYTNISTVFYFSAVGIIGIVSAAAIFVFSRKIESLLE